MAGISILLDMEKRAEIHKRILGEFYGPGYSEQTTFKDFCPCSDDIVKVTPTNIGDEEKCLFCGKEQEWIEAKHHPAQGYV